MQEELLRFKFKQKYIFFDTETEGLNLVNTRPWQVAWVETEGKNIVKKNNIMIRWDDLDIAPEAAQITGFCKEKYEDLAIDPKEAWAKLRPLFDNDSYKIVGQNLLGFDVYVVKTWLKNMGEFHGYDFVNRVIDTKSLSAAILKKIPVDSKNFLSWQYKMLHIKERGLKTSQSTMLKYYDIPFNEKMLHDALYDVEKNCELFFKQIYDIEV